LNDENMTGLDKFKTGLNDSVAEEKAAVLMVGNEVLSDRIRKAKAKWIE
jgi:hypothetical protein